MSRYLNIMLCMAIALMCGCQDFDEQELSADDSYSKVVEVLEDGQIRVTGTLGVQEMSSVSVSSRAVTDAENNIVDGWCLIFGEDAAERAKTATATYTTTSPLLLKKRITVDANGEFSITLPKFAGTAFLRVVANLTDREDTNVEKGALAWGDVEDNYETINEELWLKEFTLSDEDAAAAGYGTFGDYIYQSVGLDGVYVFEDGYSTVATTATETDKDTGITSLVYESINTNEPDPTKITDAFPMSSVGFVLEDGISEDSLYEMFRTLIYMVRVCSKVDVYVTDSDFALEEVYIISAAQEARMRSTVLSESSDATSTTTGTSDLNIPHDLGGAITYQPLSVVGNQTETPLYIYPNSGGNYEFNEGAVNKSVNPQYVVVKGRAGGYDSDGYYKIALKAQYPLEYYYDEDGNVDTYEDGSYKVKTYSDLTYNVLRNTHFKINLTMVDKPGYKTLADAADDDNPASNISYDITIMSYDGRNETLVSNGTYYVELSTTRVYMKGYGSGDGDSNSGSVVFTLYPNSESVTNGDYYHPAVYVMSDYGVVVDAVYANNVAVEQVKYAGSIYEDDADDIMREYLYVVDKSSSNTEVRVDYTASSSGRVRLRIGDMLKFIPVVYDGTPFTGTEQDLVIAGMSDFAYDQVDYMSLTDQYDVWDTSFSCDWFTSYLPTDSSNWYGYLGTNGTGAAREFRARIYPKMASGITKLYVKQDKYTSSIIDPDAYDPQDSDELRDGNVLYTNGLNGEKYEDEEDAAAQIITMLENGYTTIYFEGSVSNNGGSYASGALSIAEIMDILEDTDYTFALDLTYMDNFDEDFGNDFYEEMFNNNDNITSITLPTEVKELKKGTFNNCDNLKVVIIASVEDPSTNFVKAEQGVFTGCDQLETIIVYTTENEVTIEQQTNIGSGYFTKEEKIKNGTEKIIKYTDKNGSVTSTTSNTGYFYIFGNTSDFTDANNNYYEDLYSYTVYL